MLIWVCILVSITKGKTLFTRMKLARVDLATREHSPLNSDHSRVLSTRQDSLTSNKHTTGFTREYLPLVSYYSRVKCARQKLPVSIFNPSVITREQCSFMSQAYNMRVKCKIPQGTNRYSCFFVNLEMSCTVFITLIVSCTNTTFLPWLLEFHVCHQQKWGSAIFLTNFKQIALISHEILLL